MAISNDLFLAILAMDAYNRGYDAGIADGEGPSDANGNDADGLGEAGKQIGTATVLNVPLPEGSEAAGFYAIAYDWNGETVISYRGTNGDTLATNPMPSGHLGASGMPNARRIALLFAFGLAA